MDFYNIIVEIHSPEKGTFLFYNTFIWLPSVHITPTQGTIQDKTPLNINVNVDQAADGFPIHPTLLEPPSLVIVPPKYTFFKVINSDVCLWMGLTHAVS